MVCDVDSQHRPVGQVFLGSNHPRLLRRHLARQAGTHSPAVGRRGQGWLLAVDVTPNCRSRSEECSVAGENEMLEQRINLALPALSREYAEVTHTGLHVMAPHIGPQPRAQLVGGNRLSHRTDVVLFTL